MILGFVSWMAVAGMPPEVATASTAEVTAHGQPGSQRQADRPHPVVAGCALAVVALIPHEVALIGVRLSMLWLLVTSIVLFRGASSEAAQA